jgi:hypothetical protein
MADPSGGLPIVREAVLLVRANSRASIAEEVDERGDAIFRFSLKAPENGLELDEMFRRSILDILQLVRFYSGEKPIIIDSFSFLNEPEKRIRLLTGEIECS